MKPWASGGKIGNAGRLCQAGHERLLLGKIFDCGLERLIGGEPEILAQGIIIAIDADRARRAEESAEAFIGDEVRAVEIIVSDAHIHAHDAIPARSRGNQRAKLRHNRAHIQIENAILNEVRARGLIGSGIVNSRRVRARSSSSCMAASVLSLSAAGRCCAAG